MQAPQTKEMFSWSFESSSAVVSVEASPRPPLMVFRATESPAASAATTSARGLSQSIQSTCEVPSSAPPMVFERRKIFCRSSTCGARDHSWLLLWMLFLLLFEMSSLLFMFFVVVVDVDFVMLKAVVSRKA